MSDPAPNVGVFHSILPKAALSILSAAIVFALTGCASHNFTSSDEYANYSSSDEYADDAVADAETYETPVEEYTLQESLMLEYGQAIDSTYALDTSDETWLDIQSQNCARAGSLAGSDQSGAAWYLPPGTPAYPSSLDEQDLLGAAVAASLVSGCPTDIEPTWDWEEFWTTFDSLDPNEAADNKRYTPTGRTMLREGQQIDSTYTLDTADEMWLSIQSQNCDVAQSLGAGSDGTATWYIPTGTPSYPSPTYDVHTLLEASVAASLVTGCPEYLDPAWQEKWPAMWRNISGNLGGSSSGTTGGWSGGGGTVICSDGWVSHSGGKQGACSWHGGVG